MQNTTPDGYPFADLNLARRLEKTEASANASFVKARLRAFPESKAEWTEIGGTYAMFDGPSSPITQTFGLGMFSEVPNEQLDEIEEFFHSRGAEVFQEVCPLADASALSQLNARGYRP